MSDEHSIQQSLDAFNSLSGDDVARLQTLNTKIQNHTGAWGIQKGGERNADGVVEMAWIDKDPLIYEFLDFMDDKGLLPIFAWSEWKEGVELFESNNPNKYDTIDVAKALKLMYTVTRKDRLGDGALVRAFESGGFVQLVNRLSFMTDL